MNDANDDIWQMIQEVAKAPTPSTQVELLNHAVGLADTRQNLELGVLARKKLMGAALSAGRPEEMIAAFTWCLGQSDRWPDKVPIADLLWEYRWVISVLHHFPDISLARILAAIDDMTRRYQEAGHSLRAVHLLKLHNAIRVSNAALADEAFREWSKSPRDALSDGMTTERSFVIEYMTFRERFPEVIGLGKYVLKGPEKTDSYFGADATELLLPIMNGGKIEAAKMVQQLGYPYVAHKDQKLNKICIHIEFLARIDDFDLAASVLEGHAEQTLSTKLLLDRVHMLRAALLLVLRMRPRAEYGLKLPSEIPVSRNEGKCRLDELAKWLREDVATLSKRFDDRNGNTYLMDRLHLIDELATSPAPVEGT